MYIAEIEFSTPAFDENLRLRNEILRIPLKLEFYAADIAEEWESTHLGCYDATGNLLGSLIMKPLSDGQVKMRQVAVAEKHQKRGIGKRLVAASEVWAKTNGFSEIILHARESAVPFYLQQDYQKSGKKFTEVNIPHFKMRKVL